MEGKSQQTFFNDTWKSESKFNHDWHSSFQSYLKTQNKLKILEMQRFRKTKNLYRQIESYKKCLKVKKDKQNQKKEIEDKEEEEKMNFTAFSCQFKKERMERMTNIKKIRSSLVEEKNKEFWEIKQQSSDIYKRIKEEKEQRNRVRQMQVESRRNLIKSWEKKLDMLKQDRRKTVLKKMKEHESNMNLISEMEKKEKRIMEEINDADKMEDELKNIMRKTQRTRDVALEKFDVKRLQI